LRRGGRSLPAALRLARGLQERPLARLLLQAALLTREAELGEVAGLLALDSRVVAAYATLFFNLPGRVGEDRFKQRAAKLFAADCDRFMTAAARSGQGLAQPLRRAPGLALDPLERLLGFLPPFTNPADAARMLLRCLAGRAGGAGTGLDWDGGAPPKKPGRAAKAVRNSPWFEEVVKAAGKLMDPWRFGAAAIFSGLGHLIEESSRKARNASLYGMHLQMLINSGLSRQQAEESLHADKEARREEARRKAERLKRALRV